MTDISMDTLAAGVARQPRRDIGIKRRYAAAERRFRLYGILAISFGIAFLGIMLVTIVSKGYTAFWQTTVTLPIKLTRRSSTPTTSAQPTPMCWSPQIIPCSPVTRWRRRTT